MDNDDQNLDFRPPDSSELSEFVGDEYELMRRLTGGKGKYVRLVLAALGSIPWFGVLSAVAGFVGEKSQEKTNELLKLWLQEHRGKADELSQTIQEIVARLDQFGAQIDERIQSHEYLTLVRSTFRSWDEADTHEKKQMFKKLIANAAVTSKESSLDDLISLFINWLNKYHEAHFVVIVEIFKSPDSTRAEIWDKIHPGGRPKENSAEADLFRYLISELSIGGVIEQTKEIDAEGNRLRGARQPRSRDRAASRFMISAFEDGKPYTLTELGKRFVHYVMEDVVPLIESPAEPKRE